MHVRMESFFFTVSIFRCKTASGSASHSLDSLLISIPIFLVFALVVGHAIVELSVMRTG